MNPRITVLMPVYNGEKYLRESIESILNQTFKDFEFLIINDGSTDRTKEIIISYNDSRIRYFENEKNIGLTKSLNKGLGLAKGEYIARMDGDDISLPERLEKQIKYFDKNNEVALVTGNCEVIDEDGEIKKRTFIGNFSPEILYYRLTFHNTFPHSSVMFRKKITEIIGLYDGDIEKAQDYDLWFRISRKYKIVALDEILIKLREHKESISTKNNLRQRYFALEIFKKGIRNYIVNQEYDINNIIPFHYGLSLDGFSIGLNLRNIFSLKKIHKEIINNAPNYIDRNILKHYCRTIFIYYAKKYFAEIENKFDMAVCILFFEKTNQTKECIKSFIKSGIKIYVLSNGSSEKSLLELKKYCKHFKNVFFLEAGENLGVSGGRNFLINNTREKWLFFVDNDITINTKKWLDKTVSHILNFPETEVFIPQLYNFLEGKYNRYYGINLSEDGSIIRDFKENESINTFPGGASIINRRVFNRLGLYDENMFVGLEDVELCIRGIIMNNEVKARLINDIKLIHKHIISKKKEDLSSAKVRYDIDLNKKSWEYMTKKHNLSMERDWDWLNRKADYFIKGKKYYTKATKLKKACLFIEYRIKVFLLNFRLVRIINNFIKSLKKKSSIL